jgi:hypothetical protein
MNYTPEHAVKALEIVERLYPSVAPRPEYAELICVLRDSKRWKDAHDVFDRIRINITLPNDSKRAQGLDALFAFVAEAAAKTAFNCTDTDASFDDDSIEWLLRNEQDFLQEQKDRN